MSKSNNQRKSALDNMDWFEPIEYAPDNKIVEVLEETTEDTDMFLKHIGYNSDTTDMENFSIWCDI